MPHMKNMVDLKCVSILATNPVRYNAKREKQ